MSKKLKVGIIGPQAAGKTTYFHQLYHNLPREISGLGISFFPHKTFDDIPIDSFVPASFDSEALIIEGVATLDRQQYELQIKDTLGGHLTDPSSDEVARDLLEATQDLDMLILALDPKSVFDSQTKTTHAIQKVISNLQRNKTGRIRIALAYMKADEYALTSRESRLITSDEHRQLLEDWVVSMDKNHSNPERISSAWNELTKSLSNGDPTVDEIIQNTEYLWRIVFSTPGVTDEHFNAYLVQSLPADPPVPLEHFSMYKRGVTEIFSDFFSFYRDDSLITWRLVGVWFVLWLLLASAFIFAEHL